MKKKYGLVVLLLLSFLSADNMEEGGLYFFDLKYSEAINAFELKDYAKAAKIARFLTLEHKDRPEGYKLFADLHQKDQLYDQAIVFYKKALDLRSKFLLQQAVVDLYSDMAGCYVQMNQYDHAMKLLNNVVQWVDAHKIHNFRKKRGEAYFSLALIHRLRQEKTASRLYFLKAIADGFRKKIGYLLVAYYYVENTQDDIAENNMIYHRKKVKNEDRRASFEYFYQLFFNTEAGENYEKTLKHRADYKKVLSAVLNFKNDFVRQQSLSRDKNLQDLGEIDDANGENGEKIEKKRDKEEGILFNKLF